MSIRTLIVDDESLARERIRTLLATDEEVKIVDECDSGPSAIAAIRQLSPDLIFLDVQMPQMNGVEVLHTIGDELRSTVVFVTAFEQYALAAFDAHAVDYLLKPFDAERFEESLQRAKNEIGSRKTGQASEHLLALIRSIQPSKRFLERVAVPSSGLVRFLKVQEIDWIESAGNYVCLHVKGESHLVRETMDSLERKLNPQNFGRIHRTAIINLDRIRELQAKSNGDAIVILRDGYRLTLSRNYREIFIINSGCPSNLEDCVNAAGNDWGTPEPFVRESDSPFGLFIFCKYLF
ncbi:MAG: LytTR family DNA-binding domain-containing protein [Acidobacteriota bacterium]|nr:LytTR family DNA-binding domain-containing protein [Acidobacteriota bacterium]